jgi:hypothetical protein
MVETETEISGERRGDKGTEEGDACTRIERLQNIVMTLNAGAMNKRRHGLKENMTERDGNSNSRLTNKKKRQI